MNKSILVFVSLLSLLVACDGWFLNLKSDKNDKKAKTTTATNTRKVILVARKVYVPMYAADDMTTSDVSDRLLPVSPVASLGAAMGGQQQQPLGYSSYYQPPVAAHAMPGQGSTVIPTVNSALSSPTAYAVPVVVSDNADSALRQYAIYADGYAAAVPQYVQYGNAPVSLPETWMFPYGGGGVVQAGIYSPTGNYGESVAEELAVPLQSSEASPTV